MSGSMTGGVDSSIPLQAGRGVPQVNPLQQLEQFAGIQNALNQAKAFPGQMQLQQQAIQSGATNLAQQQSRAAYGLLTPLLTLPPGQITLDKVTTALASGEHNLGIVTQPVLQHIVSSGIDPTSPAFDSYVRSQIAPLSQGSGETALRAVTPGVGPVLDNGQSLQPTIVAPAGAPNPSQITKSGPAVPTFPSNSQLIGQVTWKDENGVDHFGTGAEYAAARGQGARVGPATPVQTGAPSGDGFPQQPAPSPQNPPRLAVAAPAGNTAGPVPGTAENATASAMAAHAANQRASTFASDMFPLTQAQTALAAAPTGKGSEAVHVASSYINTFAPPLLQKALTFITPIMTPEEVTAYDEAKKYLTQGTLGAPGATRSNEGLQTAGAANPSPSISKEAAQVVLKGMIGLRRMEQAGTLAFNNSGQPPAGYDKFMAKFATQADPHVYMFDQMTPDQRRSTLSALPPAKRGAFISQVQQAEQNGILSAPQAQ